MAIVALAVAATFVGFELLMAPRIAAVTPGPGTSLPRGAVARG